MIKKLIRKGLNYFNLAGSLQLALNSGLKEDGWFHSYYMKESVDAMGKPIPWFTYPAIKFIASRLKKNFLVYEYGSGNSSLWFSERVNKVVCVEHNKAWYEKLKAKIPYNVDLRYKSLDSASAYEDDILETGLAFDLVLIDGRKRVRCTANTLKVLKASSIIIFDNSEREKYKEAMVSLEQATFKRIDFWGMGPVVHINSCTSIFYRAGNCFDI